MKRHSIAAAAAAIAVCAACTSDVSDDGAPPDLGRSTLLAAVQGGSFGGTPVTSVASDAKNVYWIEGRGLYACAKAGCGTKPTPLYELSLDGSKDTAGGALGGAGSLVAGGGYVYWASGNAQQGASASSTIYACAITGCPNGPTTLGTMASNSPSAALAADDTGVYWMSGASGQPGGSIVGCAPTGCGGSPTAVGDLGTTSDSQATFALADGRVYFWRAINGTQPSQQLTSCPTRGGCAADTRVHLTVSMSSTGGSGTFRVLGANATSVYVIDSKQAATGPTQLSLVRCDLPSCDGHEQTLYEPPSSSPLPFDTSGSGTRVSLVGDALYFASLSCTTTGPCRVALAKCSTTTGCTGSGPANVDPDPSFPRADTANGGGGGGGGGGLPVAIDTDGVYWTAVPRYFDAAVFLLRSPLP